MAGSAHCWRIGTMPATAPIRPSAYPRREPETEPSTRPSPSIWKPFFEHTRTSGHGLPLHVEKEMRAFLEGGDMAYGFVRKRCEDRGVSRAIAFSPKKQGFSPSCNGLAVVRPRHAADRADECTPNNPPANPRVAAAILRSQNAVVRRTRHLLLLPMELLEKLPTLGHRPDLISCVTTRFWPPHARDRGRIVPPNQLRSRQLRTTIQALRPAPIAWQA